MKYCIVSSESGLRSEGREEWHVRENLERQVRKKIDAGWKPIGGVTMAIWEGGFSREYYYAQAMIKEE